VKLNQSIVHRKLDSKLKIVGLEVHDLLFVLLFAAIMNLIFGQTILGFYLVFVVPAIMAAILFIAKRNKPDGFLVHLIRYYMNDGRFSAGNKGKFFKQIKVRINESKFKR
jgi:low temperature requirement protein LtrA